MTMEDFPKHLKTFFTKISDIRIHRKRCSVKGNLIQNFNSRTKIHGDKMFKNQVLVIFNEIVKMDIFENNRTKTRFVINLKRHLVSKY